MGNQKYLSLIGILATTAFGTCCVSTPLITQKIIQEETKQQKEAELREIGDVYNNTYGVGVQFNYKPKNRSLETVINFMTGGTGFVIEQERDNSYILTNEHLVSGFLKEISVLASSLEEQERRYYIVDKFGDSKLREETKLIYLDQEKDVMILKYKGKLPKQFKRFPLAKDIKVGENVLAVGYPKSVGKFTTRGIVAGECSDDCYLNIAASEGSSGAPYLIERDGHLFYGGIINRIIVAGGEKLPYAIGISANRFYDDVMRAIEFDKRQ